jgi:hypothetical protein
MKNKRCWIILVIVVLITLVSVFKTQAAVSDPNTLRGLKGVTVMAGIDPDLAPCFKKAGIYHDQIQADVESKLKKAGIRVFTEEECMKISNVPMLRVLFAGKKIEGFPIYTINLIIDLDQAVCLSRNRSICSWATTWSSDLLGGYTGDDRIADAYNLLLDRLMNEFIIDYLSKNPNKK